MGREGGFSGRPMSCWSSTTNVPFVIGLASQYGCERVKSSGSFMVMSVLMGWLFSSFLPTPFDGFA